MVITRERIELEKNPGGMQVNAFFIPEIEILHETKRELFQSCKMSLPYH